MDTILFVIESDSSVSEMIHDILSKNSKEQVIKAKKNKLDGSPDTVLQIAQIFVSAFAAISPMIIHFISQKKIKKIKFKDIEIENPSEEQFEKVWSNYLSSLNNNSNKIE